MIVKLTTFADTFESATQPSVAIPGQLVLTPGTTVVDTVPTWGDTTGSELQSTGVTIDGSGNMDIPGALTVGDAGDLTETVSSILTITGAGTLLANTTIEVTRGSGSDAGYMHPDDFNVFNSKMDNPLQNAGDIIYGTGGSANDNLAIGSDGDVLTVVSGMPEWVDPASFTFVDPMTTIGDMVIRNGSNNTDRLAVGTNTQVLQSNGTIPVWVDSSTIGFQDPLTTNGDIIIRSGGVTTRLAVGTNTYVLQSNGTVPTWVAPSTIGFQDPMTTRGDILYRNSSNTTARLPVGSNGYVLSSNGTDVSWAAGATNPMDSTGDMIIGGSGGTATKLDAGTNGYFLQMVTGSPAWVDIASTLTGYATAALDNLASVQINTSLVFNNTGGYNISTSQKGAGAGGSFTILGQQGAAGSASGDVHVLTSAAHSSDVGDINIKTGLPSIGGSHGDAGDIYIQSRGRTDNDRAGSIVLQTDTGSEDVAITLGGYYSAGGASGLQRIQYDAPEHRFYGAGSAPVLSLSTSGLIVGNNITPTFTHYVLPLTRGTNGQSLVSDGSGNVTWQTPSGSGDIVNGGNTTGSTVTIGTNDSNSLVLESNNTARVSINPAATTTVPLVSLQSDFTQPYAYYTGASLIKLPSGTTNPNMGVQVVQGTTASTPASSTHIGGLVTSLDTNTNSTAADRDVRTNAMTNQLGFYNETFQQSAAAITTMRAGSFQSYVKGTGTVTEATGVYGLVDVQSAASKNRTVTTASAIVGNLLIRGTATSSSTVTTAAVFNQVPPTTTSAVTAVTNFYGLWLQAPTFNGTVTNSRPIQEDWAGTNSSYNSFTSPIVNANTTESTSASTGSIRTSGGISAVKNIVSGGQIGSVLNAAGNSSTAITLDWNDASIQSVTLTGNATITLSNPIAGHEYKVLATQDATGTRVITWSPTPIWPGGAAVAASTGNGVKTMFTFVWDGTSYWATGAQAFS